MKRKNISLLTFYISLNLIFLTIFNIGPYPKLTALGSLADYSMDTDLNLKFEFIGFDEEVINETAIQDNLNTKFYRGDSTIGETIMNLTVEFNYLSQTVYNNFVSFIESTAINGTGVGYDLNTTQLEHDLATGERNDILIPQDGMLIDAELTETYIYDNLFEEDLAKPGYSMFFLNFSAFDSEDHSLEHWYKVEEIDYDTNETIHSWFSSFNDIPYVTSLGWGGNHRFCFLDLSARTWYYDWIDIAWADFGMGSQIYYDYEDLDELSQLEDITSPSGNEILSEYISDYMNSYIVNVLAGYYGQFPIVESYSLQVKVFNNLTNIGYTLDEIDWVISETRIYNQLVEDFPWIDWSIDVEYVNILDYPDLYNYIKNSVQYDVDGAYVEVIDGFFYELANQLNEHFDYNAAETVLPCYFFLNDRIRFKYLGTAFAGLGGMGWEILVSDQYDLFEAGNPENLGDGMSSVMIHELGHSLGFPHPHSQYSGWGSSFIQEVMNYFSRGASGFSSFYKDALARAHGNYFYSYASMHFDFAYEDFEDAGAPDYLVSVINDIAILLSEASANYTSMDYLDCIENTKAAIDKIDLFNLLLEDPDATNTSDISTSIVVIAMTVSSVFFIFKRKRN